MTITPIVPAPTPLAGDLDRAQEILASVTATIEAAGPGAAAFTRCAIQVKSAEAVFYAPASQAAGSGATA